MNVLVTGGAGFIGSNLAIALVAKGHVVRILDNLSPQIHGDDPKGSPLFCQIQGKVDFIKGDVRVKADWEKAIAGQEVIVHLAAETGTGQSMYEIEKYVDINVRGTALMLDILVNGTHTVKKVVVASSRAIYGEGKYLCPQHQAVYPEARKEKDMLAGDFSIKCPVCNTNVSVLPTDEDSLIHPTSMYGITKHDQERMVLSICRSIGVAAVAFRYQNVYGPGQSLKNPYTGILSIFSTRLLNGNPIQVFEDGTESRDFVFIDDVVEATVRGVEMSSADDQVFNIGSGEQTTVVSVVEALKQALGKPTAQYAITGQFRLGDIRHNVADLTKARRLIGFRPSVPFQAGIERFAAWVNAQKIEEDRFEASIQEMKAKGLFK